MSTDSGRRRAAVLLMGPTGTGKSDLAIRLSREFPLEIVSVDSALVYRGMDIGTAKPEREILRTVPHHLIDIRDPATTYSAGEFVADAAATMEAIWRRGRQPLFVGGTMLYFNALTAGIAALPEADVRIRADLDARAAATGWPDLHRELARVDPLAASRISIQDSQRIQRALEVYRLTGQPISRLQQSRVSVLVDAQVLELALLPNDKPAFHAGLRQRFEAMLARGFLSEVGALRSRGDLTAEHPSMRAVGYRQVWRHLDGECDLESASERAIVATRQLAKRQLTWLRGRPRANRFDSLHPELPLLVSNALIEGGIFQRD